MHTPSGPESSLPSGAAELERRAILGIAGIAGVAALARFAQAGPVNPPAGAVGSTGRTLDEVYNKIPGANGSGDGRIPIPGGAAFGIVQPGSYVLTGNITDTTGALSIAASDVTVDLNGYTLKATSPTGLPLFLANGASRVMVRNGSVVGGQHGVSVGGALPLSDLSFEDLAIYNPKLRGISLSIGGGIDRVRLRRCSVLGCGSTTTAADASSTLIGILVGGNNARVEECAVLGMVFNGTGTPQYFGIQAGSVGGGLVARCSVSNTPTLAGIAFVQVGTCVYRDNTSVGFASGYLNGTNGGGNV